MRQLAAIGAVIFAACAAGVGATSAAAHDIYVDNRIGDDHATGARPDRFLLLGPVRSIAAALRLVASGDRVVLANTGEPYRESIVLEGERLSGLPDSPFILEGNGATLDGSQPTPPRAWELSAGGFYRFRPARLGYQQLFLDQRPAVRHPVDLPESPPPDLAPLEWCYTGGYIYFAVEPGRTVEDYDLSYAAAPTGILLNQARDIGIYNLTLQGFQLDGVNAHDGAINVELGGLTCRGNGRSGVRVAGASRVDLIGCSLRYNGTAQLLVNGFSHVTVKGSQLLSSTAPAVERRGGELWIEDAAPGE